MLSRFVVNRPPWEMQTKSLKEENIQLKEKFSHIEKKLSEAADREEATRHALEGAQKELQRLAEENQKLRSSQKNYSFAMGALVLLFGLMIGLLIGRQQKKRRSSLYS